MYSIRVMDMTATMFLLIVMFDSILTELSLKGLLSAYKVGRSFMVHTQPSRSSPAHAFLRSSMYSIENDHTLATSEEDVSFT